VQVVQGEVYMSCNITEGPYMWLGQGDADTVNELLSG
jgi:hypothetical protein